MEELFVFETEVFLKVNAAQKSLIVVAYFQQWERLEIFIR